MPGTRNNSYSKHELFSNLVLVLGTLPRTHRVSLMIWMHNFITRSVMREGHYTVTKHLSRDGTQWPIKISKLYITWFEKRKQLVHCVVNQR